MRALKLGVGSVFFATALASWVGCGGDDSGSNDTNDASLSDTGATTTRPDGAASHPDAGDGGGTVLPDGAIDPGPDSSTPDGASPDGASSDAASPDSGPPASDPGASVLQHHNHASRDGMYVEPTFTKTAVATLHADATFSAIIADGPVYAQPLYVEPGPKGKQVLIVATEQNFVYAFDAADGSIVWKTKQLASPVSAGSLPCGNIDTLGITGTPIIDFPSRTIFLGAMTTPDGGTTKKHLIYALDLDTGNVRTGWPIDVEAGLASSASPFKSTAQSQRGALALVDGVLYVPYGGFYGDCGAGVEA